MAVGLRPRPRFITGRLRPKRADTMLW